MIMMLWADRIEFNQMNEWTIVESFTRWIFFCDDGYDGDGSCWWIKWWNEIIQIICYFCVSVFVDLKLQ